MTEYLTHTTELVVGQLDKLEFGEGERERTARRAVEKTAKNKGVKNKYLGAKNPFKK